MKTFDAMLKECLKDKKFKRLYEEEVKKLDLMLKIHEEREKSGMSQADIAKKAHITQQQMSKIESGENCTLSTLLKVCQALGLDLVLQKSKNQISAGVAEDKAEYKS